MIQCTCTCTVVYVINISDSLMLASFSGSPNPFNTQKKKAMEQPGNEAILARRYTKVKGAWKHQAATTLWKIKGWLLSMCETKISRLNPFSFTLCNFTSLIIKINSSNTYTIMYMFVCARVFTLSGRHVWCADKHQCTSPSCTFLRTSSWLLAAAVLWLAWSESSLWP